MLIFGSIFSLFIGIILIFIGGIPFRRLSKYRKIIMPIAIKKITGGIKEKKHIDRFTRINYLPTVEYFYEVNGILGKSNRIYFMGEKQFENRADAEIELNKILLTKIAYLNSVGVSNPTLFIDLESRKKKDCIGVIASGILLLIISFFFLISHAFS